MTHPSRIAVLGAGGFLGSHLVPALSSRLDCEIDAIDVTFRKLGAIERTLFAKEELDWFYYLSIGLQASIVGYMVTSFFAAVAYNWFIYYLIAYAVAFRRIYCLEKGVTEVQTKRLFEWQTA